MALLHADFYGCCGAHIFYMGAGVKAEPIKTGLTEALKFGGSKAVGMVILNEAQLKEVEPVIIEYGFVRCWGPIRSCSSKNNLYGYFINLNDYRENTLPKLAQSNLKNKAA